MKMETYLAQKTVELLLGVVRETDAKLEMTRDANPLRPFDLCSFNSD